MKHTTENQICCPPFKPELWDDKTFEWQNKKFITDKVFTLFYMPLNYGGAMRRLDKKLSAAEGQNPDYLCLADHTSKWNMNSYLAVDKEIPGKESITLSGKFFSKVYEGPFRNTEKWCKDFESQAKSQNYTLKKWYMWYTTCPKCAKKYGKNYVAIIAEIQ